MGKGIEMLEKIINRSRARKGSAMVAFVGIGLMLVAAVPAQAAVSTTESVGQAAACPGNSLCVYTGNNFTGTMNHYSTENTFIQPHLPINSFRNNRSHRFFLHLSGTGLPEHCYLAGDTVSNVAQQVGSAWENSAYVYLAHTNNTPCT